MEPLKTNIMVLFITLPLVCNDDEDDDDDDDDDDELFLWYG